MGNNLRLKLESVSASLGADPMLIQGAGGNTSVKIGDTLWVKASGAWLADARKRQVFVPLSLKIIEANLKCACDPCVGAAIAHPEAKDLKPSIEASLHALMPHTVVIHAHGVNSTVVSILRDGRGRFERALKGRWNGGYIPYVRPGPELALTVAGEIARRGPLDILLLQNHGIVVGAETPEAAEKILRTIERDLAFPVRSLPAVDLEKVRSAKTETYEDVPEGNGLACDPLLVGILTTTVWTPDQVVFLGGAVPYAHNSENLDVAAQRIEKSIGVKPQILILPGIGLFRGRNCSNGARAIIRWLVDVAQRLPSGAEILSLPPEEVRGLLGWDAEKYRIQQDKQRQAPS